MIIRDEEGADGARVTLEKDTEFGVPYAITCGIYGVMFTTLYSSLKSEANNNFVKSKTLIDLYFSNDIDEDSLLKEFENMN